MTITLKHDTQCRDCGATLPAGSRARWFRNGDVYGNECHRWQIKISPEQQAALYRLLSDVLVLAKKPQTDITPAVRDRVALLASSWGRQVTEKNLRPLMKELREIKRELRCPDGRLENNLAPEAGL